MARAKRHYIPYQIWHITPRCHKREFLLKFKQDRYRWIQWLLEAKRRFGFKDYNSFASAHRKWVQAVLAKIDTKRQSRWTESIAVGGGPLIDRIKNAMGAMAKGRSVQLNKGAFGLRGPQSAYNAILDPENRQIAPKQAQFWRF